MERNLLNEKKAYRLRVYLRLILMLKKFNVYNKNQPFLKLLNIPLSGEKDLEVRGIDPRTSRMLSERSTI